MDPISITILIIEIFGFLGAGVVIYRMKQQIEALDGTIKTQAEALRTLGELNKTAVEMAKAFDPKKYVEAANAYEELTVRNAKATVEDARREFERERQQSAARAAEALTTWVQRFEWSLDMGYRMMAYVPTARRAQAIDGVRNVPDEFKAPYRKLAAEAPDWSAPMEAAVFGDILAIAELGWAAKIGERPSEPKK